MEQERGVEPADSGVAHQRVTATLHLHGRSSTTVIVETLVEKPASAPERVRKLFVGRVGIEPTSRGLRDRCKNQHLLPTLKIERLRCSRSVIHLDRSRIRPTSLRRFATFDALSGNRCSHRLRCSSSASVVALLPPVWVPPPGIEPEPLEFRSSAQTYYAREGCSRCRRHGE